VAISQERELAVLGCQVCQLVLLNWPPFFSPPMLAQIQMGPEKGKEVFWKRVNWPWESLALSQDDEVTLIGSLSATKSSVWTAQSEPASVVSPEAVHMWGCHRVRQTLRLGWVKHRTEFLQLLC
jgi:hypothetical protein